MIELFLASVINCSGAERLIANVMKSKVPDKKEVIEVIKANTKPECYPDERSEQRNREGNQE